MREMTDDNFTLTTFYASWQEYQDRIKVALASLSAEQLELRAAPGLRSVGENIMHIVGCRCYWFIVFMDEICGEEMKVYAPWNELALEMKGPIPTASELAMGLEHTWQFMADCLARWSPADMCQSFPDEWDGGVIERSRAWVVWHVLEHDLHHGGEISLILGIHGISAEFAG
ncbi:hypothetical protein KDA_54550 [Dictyobacter alpinus]|uniref:Damage-inducible protein DinB n=1 Tax=Dictyobacter alpinus TaxID=2014873 RepID=A0A402BEV9_9CHLR|nr:DinB family protein [Dictyobacter alpinus]GCE29971.1 hypothetical protein KDA_54550 [Dictyobacter alpinus]